MSLGFLSLGRPWMGKSTAAHSKILLQTHGEILRARKTIFHGYLKMTWSVVQVVFMGHPVLSTEITVTVRLNLLRMFLTVVGATPRSFKTFL